MAMLNTTTGSATAASLDLEEPMLKRLFFFSGACFRVKICDWIVNSMRLMDLSNWLCEKLVTVWSTNSSKRELRCDA